MKFNPKQALIVIHDLLATTLAVGAAFFLRFDYDGLVERSAGILYLLPIFVVYAGAVYSFFGLYKSKWRFASLHDLVEIVRASTVLAISLLALDYVLVAQNFYGGYFFGKIAIAAYWVIQIFFLGGSRMVYRYFRYILTQRHNKLDDATSALVVGRAADAEILLRAIESGAVKKIRVVGVVSPSPADQGQTIRGAPVLGNLNTLEAVIDKMRSRNISVHRLILTPEILAAEAHPEVILSTARRLGLAISRLPSLEGRNEKVQLSPIAVEDLLLRPSIQIDFSQLDRFLMGKAIVVTGGGGSIGAELCDRVVAFQAARLLIIDNSEPALHNVLERLQLKASMTKVDGRIADIRDRERIFRLLNEFRPDMVFHAAALKHVPILERDLEEAVKTNIIGSINVADASIAAHAAAMVMISTDKAIEPVSVLGATKRLAEMYCQACDATVRDVSKGSSQTRLIAVRFGNVLASNGSVVPKFKAQIDAGGPVTVTHPDMVRYFMTIREACDLVLAASNHAAMSIRGDVSVYVLNMGQPVRIVELAERMIRLSGLEPHRDIDIVFTGVRPGERLHEILFAQNEVNIDIGVPGVVAAKPVYPSMEKLRKWLEEIDLAIDRGNSVALRKILREALPDFQADQRDSARERGPHADIGTRP